MDALTTTRRIERSYRSYLRTTFTPRRSGWREAFEHALDREVELVRGPYLQATPPFAPGATTEALITEGLLDPAFRRLDPRVFPVERALHLHQEQAVRRALDGRNLLVATGTGSGKTECVLIPAVQELLLERAAGTLGAPGVRVLLLYPMNALANDQLRRFRGWFGAFPDITFGRYVGDTPERLTRALDQYRDIHGRDPLPNEMVSREQMRETPPHILVTNYSMLEYLLLRPADTAFFDGATGRHWRSIALDEAHVYDGADGAEVAMLLRRLRDRVVGSRRGALRVIATSATLGRGREDSDALVRFGSDLFDEPFASEDVVGPTRLLLGRRAATGTHAASVVREVADTLRTDEAEGRPSDPVAIAAIVGGHPAGGRAVGAVLHEAFASDSRMLALQAALDVAGALTIDEAAARALGDPSCVEEVVDLVDIGVRARERDEDAPLLPARYHHWLRGLEGAYVCLHPGHPTADARRELLLTVAERCPACAAAGVGAAMAELGICRRCRAEYLIGLGAPGSELRRTPVGQAPTAYLLLDATDDDLDEDDLAEPGQLPLALAPAAWCPGCGHLLEGPEAPCACASAPVRRTGMLALVGGEEPRLSRCLACGGGSPGGNVVGRFLTDSNAPAAVIATPLYQDLPVASDPLVARKGGEGRKILAFADSRQDAAHFAPYLERTYGRAVQRSLLLAAIEQHGTEGGLRTDDLVPPLIAEGLRHGLLEHRDSPATHRRTVLTWIGAELLATDRRQSLEGTGLVRVGPAMPPDVPQALAPLGLPDEVARALTARLIDSLRIGGVLLLPSGVIRIDEAFAPLDRDTVVRGTGSDAERNIIAWEPARSNRRRELVAKVAAAAGASVDPNAILRALWGELTARGSAWEHLLPSEQDRRRGLIRRLDARAIGFTPAVAAGTPLRCDRCRATWWDDLLGVCQTHACGGHTRATLSDASDSHYAVLYRSLRPIPLHASEHTAQWASQKGSAIQQRFLDGDLNLLSCSTTFELGVDVGDVEAVLLRNVPPSAANYVQRAGRAGRRTSGAALVVTLAQRRNHDIAWFRDPLPMVLGVVMPPRIITENPIIARRHAHSVALAASLRREEIRTVQAFFETRATDGTTGLDRFLAWLRSRPADLGAALERILPPAVAAEVRLADWSWVEALMEPTPDDPSAGWLGRAADEVRSDLRAMETLVNDAIASLQRDPGDKRAGGLVAAVGYQLRTLRETRLIEFLARRNVLPKYGFPVDVVELDLSRTGDQAADGIELDRDLRIAIAEYAPGSEVVAAGVVWRSTGLKRLPDRGWPEHGWAVCRECGRYRETRSADAATACVACGSPDTRHEGTRIRPEFGFHGARSTTVIGDEPVLRRAVMRSWFTAYGPGDPPVPEPRTDVAAGLAETLVSRQGRIVTINLGAGSRGFRMCFVCGHATPVPAEGARGAKVEHVTPWSGRPCKGGNMRTVQLSTDFLTDIIEVRFTRNHAEDILRSALYALLEGSAALGIKRREIDGTLHTPGPGRQSLVLFDTVPGGAGHALRIAEGFAAIVDTAIARVQTCDCGPETSCYGCLRGYTNQFWHESLTRAGALAALRPLAGLPPEMPPEPPADLAIATGEPGR